MANEFFVENPPPAIPVYKGAARVATVGGVPVKALIVMVMVVAVMTMVGSLWLWVLAVPAWAAMAAITRTDDRAFRILALATETRLRNPWRFWRASSYAPMAYDRKRPWGKS